MARLGLGDAWRCTFANEWSGKKAAAYRAYFGASPELAVRDVASLTTDNLPDRADLAWASFPCQDLSLAGAGAGLRGARSGTFLSFWKLIEGLAFEQRSPRLIVLENVVGAITSHGGKDFESLIRVIAEQGYRVGALVVDAVRFVPQSRPRLFVIAAADAIDIPSRLIAEEPVPAWTPRSLEAAQAALPAALRRRWVWWNLPEPSPRRARLEDLIEDEPRGVPWHTSEETERLIAMMSAANLAKLAEAQRAGGRRVGTLYRRTRPDGNGGRVQRAEVRFDGIAGCLRTPAGGSSRQTVVLVDGPTVRTRLLSPREAARLMGVPDECPVPERPNDAYHLFGDSVAVDAVAHIEQRLLHPLSAAC